MRSLRQFIRALRAQSPSIYTQLELPLQPSRRLGRADQEHIARLQHLRRQIAAM